MRLRSFLSAVQNQWKSGDRSTAVAIALLPVWLFLSVAVLFVAGYIELALGIPGPSDTGKTIGVIAFVLAGALLFGGPIWTLRRASKTLSDGGRADEVRFGGRNLGTPYNVQGCAMFAVFAGTCLGAAVVVLVIDALNKAFGGATDAIMPFVLLMFVLPAVAIVLALPAIRRWVARHIDE